MGRRQSSTGAPFPGRPIVFESAGSARLASAVRLVLLTLVALYLAHEAVYVAHFGTGHAYDEAMAAGGHTVYWPTFTLAGILAAGGLVAAATARILRLSRAERRVARGTGARNRPAARTTPSYAGEVVRLWAALWILVLPLYVGLESLESLIVSGRAVGFDAVATTGTRLVVPVVALLTFVLAALGGVVRWRIAVLEARIACSVASTARPRVSDHAPGRGWDIIGALAPQRWILTRPDAGRAPPGVLFGS